MAKVKSKKNNEVDEGMLTGAAIGGIAGAYAGGPGGAVLGAILGATLGSETEGRHPIEEFRIQNNSLKLEEKE
jgi:outer membrane lipoprotein SlyB